MKHLLLTLFVMMLTSITASAYDFEVDGIYYNINGTEATVTHRGTGPYDCVNSYRDDVTIPETVTYNGATYTVTAIGENAFYGSGLTSIEIPNSVTSIGEYAFCGIGSLESISIPYSVSTIGDWAFYGSGGLRRINISYSSITSIGEGVFSECYDLTDIDIPHSVTSIGNQAFDGCVHLTHVTIPNSVTSIGDYVFIRCIGLESIQVESGNPYYDSRNDCNAIIETASNTLVKGCKNTVIPNTVTAIGEFAFAECDGLTSMGITYDECGGGLRSIDIPNSVVSIGEYAFHGCCQLTNVTIGNSVTTIGDWAFKGCRLTAIDIPNSVTSIGVSTFYCPGLTRVISRAVNPPGMQDGVFDNMSYYGSTDITIYEQAMLFVPNESLEAYQTHAEWGRFAHIIPFLGAGPGDINGDGRLSIGDVTALISQILGGDAPAYCDVDGDGNINVRDVTALISWILNGN